MGGVRLQQPSIDHYGHDISGRSSRCDGVVGLLHVERLRRIDLRQCRASVGGHLSVVEHGFSADDCTLNRGLLSCRRGSQLPLYRGNGLWTTSASANYRHLTWMQRARHVAIILPRTATTGTKSVSNFYYRYLAANSLDCHKKLIKFQAACCLDYCSLRAACATKVLCTD